MTPGLLPGAGGGAAGPDGGERVSSDLTAVSQMLFVPLYALSLESRREDPIVMDERAVGITAELDRTFRGRPERFYRRLAEGRLRPLMVRTLALRIRRFDRYVAAFLAERPDGVVVNLGCGLDARRDRVDNGTMRWVDVDLPEVIALRRRFFQETDRLRFIAGSVLDSDWRDRLPDAPRDAFLFVAEGLFMYLPCEDVRKLVTELRRGWPGSRLVAEVAGARVVRMMRTRLGRGKLRRELRLSEDVVYRCGIEDSLELERWSAGIRVLDEWSWFDDADARVGWLRLFGRWELFRRSQWLVRLALGDEEAE